MKPILHIKAPLFSQFRFEWHGDQERVYLIRLDATPLHGEPIAFAIKTHGDAQNAVLIWLRGYRQARLEIDEPRELLKLA